MRGCSVNLFFHQATFYVTLFRPVAIKIYSDFQPAHPRSFDLEELREPGKDKGCVQPDSSVLLMWHSHPFTFKVGKGGNDLQISGHDALFCARFSPAPGIIQNAMLFKDPRTIHSYGVTRRVNSRFHQYVLRPLHRALFTYSVTRHCFDATMKNVRLGSKLQTVSSIKCIRKIQTVSRHRQSSATLAILFPFGKFNMWVQNLSDRLNQNVKLIDLSNLRLY